MFFVRVVTVLFGVVLPVDCSIGRECGTRGRNVKGDLRNLEFIHIPSVLNILDARCHPPCGVGRVFILAAVNRLHGQGNMAMGAVAGGVEKATVLHRAALGIFVTKRFKFLRRTVILEDEIARRTALTVAVEIQFLGTARLAPETEIMDGSQIRHAVTIHTQVRLEDVGGILRDINCTFGTFTLPNKMIVEIVAPDAVFRTDESNGHAAKHMIALRRKLGISGREYIFLFVARISGP